MLKNRSLFLFLIFYSGIAAAQPPLVRDSLVYVINSAKKDSSGVQNLYRVSTTYLQISPDSALAYANKAMQWAGEIRYDSGYFSGLKFTANALLASGKLDEMYLMGEKGLSYAEKIGKPAFKGRAYFTMAVAKQFQYQILLSIDLYKKALPYFEANKDKPNLARVYQNVANLFYEQHAFDKGIDYANKAFALNVELKDTVKMLECQVLTGNLFYGSKKLEQAHIVYESAIKSKTFERLSPTTQFISNVNLGSLYYDREQYDSSLYWLLQADAIKTKFQLLLFSNTLLYKTASTYIKLGNLTKAGQLLTDAARQNQADDGKTDFYETSAEYYTATGDYQKANKQLSDLMQYKDSVNTEETAAAFLQMDSLMIQSEKQRLLDQKELSIQLLQKQAAEKNKTIALLVVGSLALVITGFLLYLFFKKKEQLKNKSITLLNKEKEFIAVKSSLEGQLQERGRISKEIHDELGSSLTSISLLTEVLKKRLDARSSPEVYKISDTSAEMVDKMNEIIWALNTSNDTINSLTAYMRKFANNFLQDANIELEFLESNIPENQPLEGTVRRHIYLTVKEAINNVVKHSGAKKVVMNVDAASGLHIQIKDDGKGIDPELKQGFGNGLANMRKRMEEIGGSFNIESKNGTVIRLMY
jgi:signal transduction histidine kinase